MPSLAELLGYLVQPLGGPLIPALPKSPTNATGGSIPGVVGPKGPPLSSPAEMMNALTAIGNTQSEAKLRAAQIAELERQAELRKQLAGSFDQIMASLGSGGGASAAATPAAAPAIGSSAPGTFGALGGADAPAGRGVLPTIRKYESGDDYNVGVGGADLSKAPRDEYGFPIWEGRGGSHAAGAYQFQPGTWRQYAEPLGVKDFSQASQDAVARAAYLDQGVKPWAPYNPKLAAALARGEHLTGDAGDQEASQPAAANNIAPAGAPLSLAPVVPPTPQAPTPAGITPLQMAIAKLGALGTLSKLGDVAGPLEKALYNSPAFQGQVAGAKKGGEYPYDTAATLFKADLDARNAAIAAETARINADLLAGRLPGPGAAVGPRLGFAQTEAINKAPAALAEATAREKAALDRQKAEVDPSGFGAAPSTVPAGPGITEPAVTERGTIIPPVTAASPITGSIKAVGEQQTQWNKTINDLGSLSTASRQIEQRGLMAADVLKGFQSGAWAGTLADLRAKMQALGIPPSVASKIADDPAAAQKLISANFLQTVAAIKGMDSNPATYQIKIALGAWANPENQPAANQEFAATSVGVARWQQAMYRDWNEAKKNGWRDPHDFMQKWSDIPDNSVQTFVDKARAEIGPLKGMEEPRAPTAKGIFDEIPWSLR